MDKKNNKRTTIYLDAFHKEMLKDYSELTGFNNSEVIREALRLYVHTAEFKEAVKAKEDKYSYKEKLPFPERF